MLLSRFFFALFLILTFGLNISFGQEAVQFCEQVSALQNLIKQEHAKPKAVNDSLSVGVFELFLESLDPEKRFFVTSDIALFKQDRLKIDDYILSDDCDFINKYITTLQQRIQFTQDYLNTLYKTELDYSGKDTLHFQSKSDFQYFKSETELQLYWNKKVRYKLLTDLIEQDSVLGTIQKKFKKLERDAKPKIISNELCLLDGIKKTNGGLQTFVREAFLNALANYQDPNTIFFNNSNKDLFETSLSSNQMSFGFSTTKNSNGDLVVNYIVPGSVAYKNENFEENDIIKTLTSGKDVLETYCVSDEDIQAFTNDHHHDRITFKIKKQDGQIINVSLEKAVIKVEENLTRAYILESKTRIGYINIPSFYTDFENPDGLGLANDMAKELYKLQKENIKGLIIDLRYNGGGSMKEASDLSGMFINRGPLSILKYKTGETYTVKDAKRGMLFSNPIVILINGFSASASEYFAATLQDYNRAIIVGTPSYGKASAQVILPLNEIKDLGYCKLTTDQFYRVTGKSTQSTGVIPDIVLPDLYDNFKTSEGFQKYALENDEVAITLKHIPLKPLNLTTIKNNSETRVNSDSRFKGIRDINAILVADYFTKETEYLLTLENIYNDQQSFTELWKQFYKLNKNDDPKLIVTNTTSTTELLSYNLEEEATNSTLLEEIAGDTQLEEAFTILSDYLKLSNQN
ncbi:S41 family peptidase [Ulvibacter antarcticus]|nr:S41 family peptidase [Ulvibacter antarcticus]